MISSWRRTRRWFVVCPPGRSQMAIASLITQQKFRGSIPFDHLPRTSDTPDFLDSIRLRSLPTHSGANMRNRPKTSANFRGRPGTCWVGSVHWVGSVVPTRSTRPRQPNRRPGSAQWSPRHAPDPGREPARSPTPWGRWTGPVTQSVSQGLLGRGPRAERRTGATQADAGRRLGRRDVVVAALEALFGTFPGPTGPVTDLAEGANATGRTDQFPVVGRHRGWRRSEPVPAWPTARRCCSSGADP